MSFSLKSIYKCLNKKQLHILEILHWKKIKIAPKWNLLNNWESYFKVKKKNNIYPFKTPQDYFSNFEARLFQKMEEERFPKSSGLKVPEAYFDNMEQRMLEVATADDKKKVIPLFPKKYFGYAAAIAAIFIIGIMLFTSKSDTLTMENIQLSIVDQYIEDGNLNLDLYDLTNYLDDGDISGINFETLQIPDGVLENYLFDNMEGNILMDENFDPFE